MASTNIVTTNNTNVAGSYIPSNSQSFSEFYNAFRQALSQTKTWSILQDAGVGSQLLSNLATLGVSCEYFTQRRLQEAFIDTAQSPLSIYEGVNLLGGTIIGNIPSSATVMAVNGGATPVVLDAYTTFTINGGVFYNPTTTTIAAYGSVSFPVIEGNPVQTTVQGADIANQIFYVSNNYKCNNLVTVTVQAASDSIPATWSKVDNMWLDGSFREINPITQQQTNIPLTVYQSTLYPTGQVQITFGDGVNGQRPQGSILITAYEASGGAYNLSGVQQVIISTYDGSNSATELGLVSLSTTSVGVIGGSPKPSTEIYKVNASARFATNDRFVTAQDFEAGAITFHIGNLFPIKAVRALGERDLYPGASSLANVVTLVLVMYDDDFNVAFLDLFSSYIESKGVFCVVNPVKALPVTFNNFNITVSIQNANLTEAQIASNIKSALINLIGAYKDSSSTTINIDAVSSTSLGRTWYLSEFYKAIISVIEGNQVVIDYSYEGINADFTIGYAEYIFIDFTSNFQINFI